MTWPPVKKPETAAQAIARMQRDAARRKGDAPPKPARRTLEWDFQESLVAELRVLTIAPARFFFVPNGGNLSKAQRGRFKAMGLTAGVHDLHFAWRTDPPRVNLGGLTYNGPWLGSYGAQYGTLELKAGRNTTSDEQDDFARDLHAMGHHTATVHADQGVDHALEILRGWSFPLRTKR